MIFTGLVQHAAMPNNSDKSRTGLLLQYLPKCMFVCIITKSCLRSILPDSLSDVKPMEDMKRNTLKEIRDQATPIVRQVPFIPCVLDHS